MKWEGRRESDNVEDRRGTAVKAGAVMGGGGLILLLSSYFLCIGANKIAPLVGGGGG
ncbi:MAG: neutral zinc metallopeptidase, partial [Gemmataceae bacterium]|nr:neutral zinc metallopeptidase [Gemmataceae bacterium]